MLVFENAGAECTLQRFFPLETGVCIFASAANQFALPRSGCAENGAIVMSRGSSTTLILLPVAITAGPFFAAMASSSAPQGAAQSLLTARTSDFSPANSRHAAPAPTTSETSKSGDKSAAPIPADRIGRATAGVLGGPHDFSAMTGRVADACSACHVPHVVAVRPATRTSAEAATVPSAAETEHRTGAEPDSAPTNPGVLELYRIAGQRQVYAAGRFMPGATSLICLSCHDGSVASSTLGASHALLAAQRSEFFVPDGFVWHDHPIGISYPEQREGYRSLHEVLKFEGLRLPEGRVECVTCHDPHGAGGQDKLLSMSNRRSALCLACHEK